MVYVSSTQNNNILLQFLTGLYAEAVFSIWLTAAMDSFSESLSVD